MEYFCKNCKKIVQPHYTSGQVALTVFLLMLGLIPGLIFIAAHAKFCPICGTEAIRFSSMNIVSYSYDKKHKILYVKTVYGTFKLINFSKSDYDKWNKLSNDERKRYVVSKIKEKIA